jgi:hypothetical protein
LTFRTLLVGLGKIGFEYSYPNLNSDTLLTHTATILAHKDFDLVCAVDPNPIARAKFQDLVHLESVDSLSKIEQGAQFDLVVVATPTHYHEKSLKEVFRFKPRLVLMEKPLSMDFDGAKRMKEALVGSGIKLVMNFQRSYTLEILEIARRIGSEELTGPYHVNFRYTGTPKNSGSHIISIIQKLFPGENQLIMKDGYGSCFLNSKTHLAKIVIERIENFEGNIFEFTILSAQSEIKYNSTLGTITERKFQPQEYYDNEITIESGGSVSNLQENKALCAVYDQLSNYLSSKKYYLLDIDQGLENNFLVELFLENGKNEI